MADSATKDDLLGAEDLTTNKSAISTISNVFYSKPHVIFVKKI